jgi:hypothetical protein
MMRAHSSTNNFNRSSTTRRLGGLLLAFCLASCGDGFGPGGSGDPSTQGPGTSKLAIRWTLGGLTLTETRCAQLGIGSMDVYLLRPSDNAVLAVWSSVVCGLDRYSLVELPFGTVKVHVEAIQTPGATMRKCVPYLGETLAPTGPQFNDPPVTVALKAYSTCL